MSRVLRASSRFVGERVVRHRRWLLVALGVLGVVLVGLSLPLLTTEVRLFRNPGEFDFGSLTCGAPLDNPGWRTGSPCHGAVNRQTAVAWSALFNGIGALVAAIVALAVDRRGRNAERPTGPTSTTSSWSAPSITTPSTKGAGP